MVRSNMEQLSIAKGKDIYGVPPCTLVDNRDMGNKPEKEIAFSHGEIIRKYEKVAGTLYNKGMALICVRIHLRR